MLSSLVPLVGLGLVAAPTASAGSESALSDEPIPYQVDEVPDRPRPLLELGEPFLGTGPLGKGIRLCLIGKTFSPTRFLRCATKTWCWIR